jgi:uncharacterized membrane protein YdjX (TVP38/TMEM64 family)
MEKSKKIMLIVWLTLIAAGLTLYFIFPEHFTQENISAFVRAYEGQMLLVYFLICVARGAFLIPSTPFVLAGGILFPDNLWMVLAISMAGVMAGSCFIYYFTEFLGVDKVIQKRFGHKLERTRRGMDKYGFWIVVAWSFFPLVPTDLIAYVAGITRMPAWKFLPGVFLGELPIVSVYVFAPQIFLNTIG